MELEIDRAAAMLRDASRVAVLTGAGISAESGLSTFRDAGGLWEGHDPAQVATPEAFQRDPALVWRFYNHRRRAAFAAKPNAGHLALAQLAGLRETMIVTQNVDRLHRRAGSERVIEIHGNLEDVRCTGCGETFARPGEDLPELPACDACGALLRPSVVWFGEALPDGAWEAAAAWVRAADLLLVVGTSAVVYPAAGLVPLARRTGAGTIEINPIPSDAEVDLRLPAKAAAVLPELVRRVG